jgi:hypothetical protein
VGEEEGWRPSFGGGKVEVEESLASRGWEEHQDSRKLEAPMFVAVVEPAEAAEELSVQRHVASAVEVKEGEGGIGRFC